MRVAIPATLLAAVILLMLGLLHLAHGAPPPGADGARAEWFHSLKTPAGGDCCGPADCREVEARVKDGHWQAFIAGQWLTVPDEKLIVPEKPNPTGQAVACWRADLGFLCFTRPIEV